MYMCNFLFLSSLAAAPSSSKGHTDTDKYLQCKLDENSFYFYNSLLIIVYLSVVSPGCLCT